MEVYGTHIWQTNHHWIFDLSCCGGLGKHQENKHSLSYVENVQQKTLTWHEPWVILIGSVFWVPYFMAYEIIPL